MKLFFHDLFLFAVLLCLFLPTASHARDYQLYPENKGTTDGTKFYGLWQIENPSPGDVIYCHDDFGPFTVAFLVKGWKGTTDNPITIKAAPGETPVLETYVDIQESQHIVIDGLTITNTPYGGVMIQNGSDSITVSNCIVRNCGLGIWIANGAGMNHRIMNNQVFSNTTQGIAADRVNCTAGHETVISGNRVYDNGYMGFEMTGNYYIIENNEVYDNGKSIAGTSGIHIFSYSADDGTGDHNIIRYNITHDNRELQQPGTDGNGIQVDQWCDYNQVYYNLSYNNDGAGINIYDSADNSIFNNTLYGNMKDPINSHLLKGEMTLATDYTKQENLDLTRNNSVVNNIIVATRTGVYPIYIDDLTSDNPLIIKNNLLYHTGNGPLYFFNGSSHTTLQDLENIPGNSGNIQADPLFVKTQPSAQDDFKLSKTSPAIGKGVDVNLHQDIEGQTVLQGTAPDIGAFETVIRPKNFKLD